MALGKKNESTGKPEPDEYVDSVRDQEVVEESTVTQTNRIPGAAVMTREDKENLDDRLAEDVADPEYPEPAEYKYGGVDVRTPEQALATRSNIVPDGPGTVGDPSVLAAQ